MRSAGVMMGWVLSSFEYGVRHSMAFPSGAWDGMGLDGTNDTAFSCVECEV